MNELENLFIWSYNIVTHITLPSAYLQRTW